MESFAFGCKLPSRRPLEISAVITEGILAGSSGVEHLTAILLMYTYLLYYDMARGSLSGVGLCSIMAQVKIPGQGGVLTNLLYVVDKLFVELSYRNIGR